MEVESYHSVIFLIMLLYIAHQTALTLAESHFSVDDCNFDDASLPMCHWRHFGTDLTFKRHSGSTMSHSTGPMGDHSTSQNGSYIYLEASNSKFGNTAKLISKVFDRTVGRTLKFYVYMYGASINYLKVMMRRSNHETEELMKISGNQGQKWIEVKIRIVSLMKYQLIFEAAVGRTFKSDIAIDDVTFIDDKVLRSGWSEWSSWTNCQVKDEWCRKDRFRLCLDAKSCHVHDKLEKQVSSCALANCRVDGHWSEWATWSSCSSKCGQGSKSRHRECNEPKPLFGGKSCVGEKVKIISCWSGFCKIGEDDCDFDDESNPFCHWINSNDTLKFQRKYLWTGTAGTGPSGDHSNNNHGKYIYLETSAPAKYGDFAQMTSKLFKPTKSRTLKFFTYMYGRSVNYLKVLIKTNNSSKEIWKLEGNQGKRWLLARIDFSCPMSYQVIFEAGVGKDFQSDIAIDTIHFEDPPDEKKYERSSYKQQESNNSNQTIVSELISITCILLSYLIVHQKT